MKPISVPRETYTYESEPETNAVRQYYIYEAVKNPGISYGPEICLNLYRQGDPLITFTSHSRYSIQTGGKGGIAVPSAASQLHQWPGPYSLS